MRILFVLAVVSGVLASPGLAQEKPKADEELAKLAGTWKVVSTGGHGKVVRAGDQGGPDKELWRDTVFTIKDDQLVTQKEPVVLLPDQLRPKPNDDFGPLFAVRQETGKYRLKAAEAGGRFAQLDLIVSKNAVLKGIYELKEDELKVCVVNWLACQNKAGQVTPQAVAAKLRPTDFTTRPGGDHVSFVLKRVQQ